MDDAGAPTLKRWVKPILVGALVLVLNIVAYFLIPPDFAQQVGPFGYLGVLIVTFIANATVAIPVPYIPLVMRLSQELNVTYVVLLGALGSVLGESVAFFAGRVGRNAVNDTKLYRWVRHQMRKPWRAWLVLLLLAAPLNPVFDVAGLTAGAMGLPYWLFASAVFLGRIIRIAGIPFVGTQIA
jgi:membrane protein YqaA with SNARE-associated domain